MLGRRTALVVVLAGATSFGGGAALAAAHGGSAHTLPPKQPRPAKHQAVSNVHIPCHNHGAASRSL